MTKEDEQTKIVKRAFYKTFFIVFIPLMIIFLIAGGSWFFSFGGLLFSLIFSSVFALFIAFIVAVARGAYRRGRQIGDIIEAKHKEVKKSKR